MKYALTITATDTSSGAGIYRDLEVFQKLNLWGLNVATGVTVQNFDKVEKIFPFSSYIVEDQLKFILQQFPVSGIKIGITFSRNNMELIKNYLIKYSGSIVIDPIVASSSGYCFVKKEDMKYFCDDFLSIADVITPNISELAFLSGVKIKDEKDIIRLGQDLQKKYQNVVLVSGGHKSAKFISNWIFYEDGYKIIEHPRKKLSISHGTGCRLSSAILGKIIHLKETIKAVSEGIKFTWQELMD
ncbi:MAG: bifunctional hydroxymethylpyrimidine kinase/phosphomethylpyrimidine kinase [Candidatus Cloacimonadota bacterium]|nr:MAG: bifunctional hydroxymethylpyrimidine kinase/phosphomethylpyrimidine kinase [Candidatus Cloacimonadota bacterium]